MDFVVVLENVNIGKTKNWLEFEGYVPRLNVNRIFQFDYCGTEISTNAGLNDKQKQKLLEEMQDLFEYAPFDSRIESIKESLPTRICIKNM